MHSPLAQTEHVSLNLARFFARPCTRYYLFVTSEVIGRICDGVDVGLGPRICDEGGQEDGSVA